MVPALCFLSGAAALVFESVWFHRASLVFGGSVWSTSLVLSSFMGGLALGSALVARRGVGPIGALRAYAIVEATVAITGILLTLALPGLTSLVVSLTQPDSGNLWATNAIRFVTAFLLLLVPSTAMGASLPLLVGAIDDRRARGAFGSALGLAYGLNTLGAVAGVIVGEVWLVEQFGIAGAAWSAAALSLSAAAVAAMTSAPTVAARVTVATESSKAHAAEASILAEPHGPRGRLALGLLLASSFVAGAALLALEVVWFRFLTLFVLSTTLAASVMLAAVLVGIALGGLAAAAWLSRVPTADRYLPAMAALCGIAVATSYAMFHLTTSGTQIGVWPRTLWLALVMTLPTSFLSGVLFTLTGAAVQRAVTVGSRAAGFLSVANTAGGMVGPLVSAFVLLPRLGTERALALVAGSYVLVGALALAGLASSRSPFRSWPTPLATAGLLLALALFPIGAMEAHHVPRVAAPYQHDGSTIVATREGPSETIFLMQQRWLDEPVYTRLVTNGFSMSGTSVSALRYMRYFAYWPAALRRGPLKRVLLVCFGVGVTASAVLDVPSVETLDIAEISQDVIATSDLIHRTDHPLKDPRVRLHVEDGRQFLERTAERFDLITGEPPPPRTPGAVNIYTREYFALMRDRLSENGLVTYWLPVARPDPGTNVTSIIRAFCDVFDDCSLWNATPFDLMLVGSRSQGLVGLVGGQAGQVGQVGRPVGPVGEDDFVRPWTIPALRARLVEIGFELPQQLGATFLGDAEYLRELTADSPALDDDHPHRLHPVRGHPSLSDPGYGSDESVTRLYRTVLDPARARAAFERSAYIRALWPSRVLDATLPYFDHQNTMNQVLFEGGRPLARIETLHHLLSETPLRTLPLWMLGSDDVKGAIAARRDDGTGAPIYARGLSALVARDYPGAAAAFTEAEARGLRGETVRPLRVYALWAAGRRAEAQALAASAQPGTEDEQRFWEWMKRAW